MVNIFEKWIDPSGEKHKDVAFSTNKYEQWSKLPQVGWIKAQFTPGWLDQFYPRLVGSVLPQVGWIKTQVGWVIYKGLYYSVA